MEPSPPQSAAQQNNHPPLPSSTSPSSSSAVMLSSHGSTTNMKPGPGLMGKHRMTAAISLLNQQIQTIQDELDQLETVDGVFTVCEELISGMESISDALLPETRGPAEAAWDRWFQGAQSSRNRRRWI